MPSPSSSYSSPCFHLFCVRPIARPRGGFGNSSTSQVVKHRAQSFYTKKRSLFKLNSSSSFPSSRWTSTISDSLVRGLSGAGRAFGNEFVPRASASASGFEESLEELARKSDAYFESDDRPIILFDGVCNFCNAGVNFVLQNDAQGKLRLCALQSDAGKLLLARSNRLPDDISSVVLVEKNKSYIKSDAVLRTAFYLNFPFPPLSALALLVPMFFRDPLYDLVADNRYNLLGMRDECRYYDDSYKARFVT